MRQISMYTSDFAKDTTAGKAQRSRAQKAAVRMTHAGNNSAYRPCIGTARAHTGGEELTERETSNMDCV